MRFLLAAVLLSSAAAAASPAPKPEPTLTVEGRAFRPGELLLASVTGHDAKTPPEATWRGAPLTFFPGVSSGTWLAFIGLDLEAPVGPAALHATLRAPGGKPFRRTDTFEILPSSFPVVDLKVEQKFVTPEKNDAERAEAESQKLHKLFSKTEEKRLFEGRFDSPIPGASTARFGERRVFNGQPRAPHSGMDLKAGLGRPVRAPAAGKVLLADPLFFAGKTVILDHGLGLTTQYAHLSKFLVKAGDVVKKGQLIGKVGATGRVTGPHLHWALKYKTSRIDPFSLTWLDLDAKLRAKLENPLSRSPLCEEPEAAPKSASRPKWGKAAKGLRGRARAARPVYAPGEPVSLIVELRNETRKPLFVDFVRDAALRPLVLGVGEPARPYEALASSKTASGPLTEQVKIPKGAILCFEQAAGAAGPLLAAETTAYALTYDTAFLYPSTAARAGVWSGRLAIPPAAVVVSTSTEVPSAP